MGGGSIVAETGNALRYSLAAWFASGESGAPEDAAVVAELAHTNSAGTTSRGMGPAALIVKLMRVATSSSLRNGLPPRADRRALQDASVLDGLELEYLAWPVVAQAVEEERLIGAALEWLMRTPVLEVKGEGFAFKVALAQSGLSREEVAQLWSASGGVPLLAFSVRVVSD